MSSIYAICDQFTNAFYYGLQGKHSNKYFTDLAKSYNLRVISECKRKKDQHAFSLVHMSLCHLRDINFTCLAYEYESCLYSVDKAIPKTSFYSVERLLEKGLSQSEWDTMKKYTVYQTTEQEIEDRLNKELSPFVIYS